MILRVHLPGFTPVGMPRAKVAVFAGRPRLYTPSRGAAAKDAIRLFAMRAVAESGWILAPRGVALTVTVFAQFTIPASKSKRRREAMVGTLHAQKPDCDNVAKMVLDALTGIAWVDDDQVGSLAISKCWGEIPCLTITVDAGEWVAA